VIEFHENCVRGALTAIAECPVPVAAVGGVWMGGGLEIAAVCDLRIAGESSLLGAPVQSTRLAIS
jgi:enoyl-CoA hydratase/carnithine racemase